MTAPQSVCILGGTGSVGTSTLAVMEAQPDAFVLHSISGHSNVARMLEVCQKFTPKQVVMVDAQAAEALRVALNNPAIEVLSGQAALLEIAADPKADMVMAAIVGAAGLEATLAAVRANKKVLLANKESLVMSGALFMQALQNSSAQLLPVDSEHNAIFQSMPADFKVGQAPAGVRRILLTGSGGPFRTTPEAELAHKTPAEAVAHPNWSMGAKISVDSATMMNKGLEWIEAKWLFAVDDAALEIVVHPQSVIHSMVEYTDGSVLAQLGQPDMKIPIAHCMGYPQRIDSGASFLDFHQLQTLSFEPPDENRFPALRLTREAWAQGGDAMAVLNAANEVAVAAFLAGQIGFATIAACVEETLAQVSGGAVQSLEQVLQADTEARRAALGMVAKVAI